MWERKKGKVSFFYDICTHTDIFPTQTVCWGESEWERDRYCQSRKVRERKTLVGNVHHREREGTSIKRKSLFLYDVSRCSSFHTSANREQWQPEKLLQPFFRCAFVLPGDKYIFASRLASSQFTTEIRLPLHFFKISQLKIEERLAQS